MKDEFLEGSNNTVDRLLLIDQNPAGAQALGLECLERGIGVSIVDNLCEAVRVIVDAPVSLIVADGALLRLTPRENAILFERVAPGVPVVVTVRADAPLDQRVAWEIAGFRVLSRPVIVEELLEKTGVK